MPDQIRPGKGILLPALLMAVVLLFAGTHSVFAATHIITATAGPGGEIDPDGEVKVKTFRSKTFDINPDNNYLIEDVLVDGVSVGPVDSYRFTFVTRDHTIHATFVPKNNTIIASAGEGGQIYPEGKVSVDRGDDQRFEIKADPDYSILDVLVDGESQGPLREYTFTNVSADHEITATFDRFVEVLDVSIPNESMKIGDVVPVSIRVSDDGGVAYTLVSGSVGGYPLEGFDRLSATEYQAEFTIVEGGNSFLAQQDIPVSELQISDGDMNSKVYDQPIRQDNDPIDAIFPVIIRLEVPSQAVGIGGSIIMTISSDGADYTLAEGSQVNGIPLSSSRLMLTELGDGVYELSLVVETGDNPVAPGSLAANIIMMDEAGNIGDPYQIIEPNTLEVYTDLPEATLVGPSRICEGEVIQLSVHLRGRSPWSFDLDDGINNTTFEDISSPDFKITVAPAKSTTYLISSVRDVNGVENMINGELLIEVDEVSAVEIINLATGYDVDADPVQLEANIPGGTFTGPGVISSTGYFYPDLADTIDSPHTIYYTYTNDNGCISADSALVYVLGNEGAILIPANAFCKGEDPFDISVMNVPVSTGSFILLDAASQPVTGLTDNGDNTASIDPDLLDAGSYTIEYHYVDLIPHFFSTVFSVEFIDQPRILNLYDSAYCQNESPFILQADMPNVVFEGPGVTGNSEEGFLFSPSEADPGRIWISCIAETENGCRASSMDSLDIKFAPTVLFALSSECLPEGGEQVSFENQTNDPQLVETWMWDFGDPGSGANNYSNKPDPVHLYQETGLKNIILKAISLDGCSSFSSMEAVIDSKPVADFTWLSDCFSEGSAVKFVNQSSNGSAIVDTLIWTIKGSDGSIMDEFGSSSVSDTLDYLFTSPDEFMVSLYIRNRGGCDSDLEKELVLRPTIQLDSEGYLETFDASEGLWTVRSEEQLESWTWGIPDFNGYIPDDNDKAWYTQLPQGEPDYYEQSWIQSPCFDFREIERPLIRVQMMRSFFPYLNGAVLQYRDIMDEGWHTLGDDTPGIEWYNVSNIINMPGGSSIGWGLEEFIPDTEWVTAIHDLDQLEGKANVDLRIVISSNGRMEVGNQGMAVNQLQIAERTKLSLLEHFTNSSDDTARMADDIVDAFANTHSGDIIDLQYHMAYPGNDLMNLNNPDPSSTRSGNYGVPNVPYVILDGGFSNDHRYDFSELSGHSLEDHLRLLSLETPVFDIDLNVNWMVTSLEAEATVSCRADRYDENVQLYLVVFEHTVTSYLGGNGDTQFRNVVLDMLPTPAGKLLGDNWRKGDSDTRINIWPYAPYIEDINDLGIAAFVQERSSGRILQAVVDYKDETVGLFHPASQIQGLELYPNPANHSLFVNFGGRTEQSGLIELMDINGRVVRIELCPEGYQLMEMDIDDLNPGMYILRWIESDELRGISKFVKTQ